MKERDRGSGPGGLWTYPERKRLLDVEGLKSPETPLGLEIPDDRNPASPAYRYGASKPLAKHKSVSPDAPVTRTRASLLRNPTFVGRFRDRPPKEPRGLPPRDATVAQPEQQPVDPHSESAASTNLELLSQRPRDMHRDITEFEALQGLMEQTPGDTMGTDEAMDSLVSPRLTRTQMRNQTPNYWPGSTDPTVANPDWDPREAVVHPDRADNRRHRLITSSGAPLGLRQAMDSMFKEHTGESNPFAGTEASKRRRL